VGGFGSAISGMSLPSYYGGRQDETT